MGKVRLRDLDPAIFLNKVGIGTDNPAEMLDVVGGNVRIGKTTNGRLTIENSSGTEKIKLDSAGDCYIGGGDLEVVGHITIPNAKSYKVKNSSGVGLGVVSLDSSNRLTLGSQSIGGVVWIYDGYSTPSLSVQGQKVGVGTGIIMPTANLQIHQETVPGGQRMLDISTKEGNIFSVCNEHQNRDGCYLRSEGSMFLGTNADIDTVHIDGGKVGIGTGSSVLRGVLHVQRDTATDNSTLAYFYGKGSTVTNDAGAQWVVVSRQGPNNSGQGTGGIWFSQGGKKPDDFAAASAILGGYDYTSGRSLHFLTSDDNTSVPVKRAVLTGDGKFGIGTGSNTFSSKLHVGTRAGNTSDVSIGDDDNNRAILTYIAGTTDAFTIGTRQGSTNYFDTLAIKDGNVRIGATDGSSKLNVGGDICLLANNSTADRKDGITEHAILCNNEGGSGGKEFNLADITRDTASWGNSNYIVEIFAHYPSGGSYAKYFVYYAYSGSGVITLENPKGVNTTGYAVRLAGEQTVSGNIKRASIMVDLPAYGRATIRLTHNGVYNIDEWTSSNENLAGRIKYNL